MPLVRGRGDEARQRNIQELVSTYNAKGKIGNTKPKSKAQAVKIAAAIAYRKSRER